MLPLEMARGCGKIFFLIFFYFKCAVKGDENNTVRMQFGFRKLYTTVWPGFITQKCCENVVHERMGEKAFKISVLII